MEMSGVAFRKRRLKRDLKPSWRLQKVDMLSVSIHRTFGIQAICLGMRSKGIGVIDNDLQHRSGGHARAFGPDFDPTFASGEYGASKAAILRRRQDTGEIHLWYSKGTKEARQRLRFR